MESIPPIKKWKKTIQGIETKIQNKCVKLQEELAFEKAIIIEKLNKFKEIDDNNEETKNNILTFLKESNNNLYSNGANLLNNDFSIPTYQVGNLNLSNIENKELLSFYYSNISLTCKNILENINKIYYKPEYYFLLNTYFDFVNLKFKPITVTGILYYYLIWNENQDISVMEPQILNSVIIQGKKELDIHKINKKIDEILYSQFQNPCLKYFHLDLINSSFKYRKNKIEKLNDKIFSSNLTIQTIISNLQEINNIIPSDSFLWETQEINSDSLKLNNNNLSQLISLVQRKVYIIEQLQVPGYLNTVISDIYEKIDLTQKYNLWKKELEYNGILYRQNLNKIKNYEKYINSSHLINQTFKLRHQKLHKINQLKTNSNLTPNILDIDIKNTINKIKELESKLVIKHKLNQELIILQNKWLNKINDSKIQIVNNDKKYHHKFIINIEYYQKKINDNKSKLDKYKLEIESLNNDISLLKNYDKKLIIKHSIHDNNLKNINRIDIKSIKNITSTLNSYKNKVRLYHQFINLYNQDNIKIINRNQNFQVRIKNNIYQQEKLDNIISESLNQIKNTNSELSKSIDFWKYRKELLLEFNKLLELLLELECELQTTDFSLPHDINYDSDKRFMYNTNNTNNTNNNLGNIAFSNLASLNLDNLVDTIKLFYQDYQELKYIHKNLSKYLEEGMSHKIPKLFLDFTKPKDIINEYNQKIRDSIFLQNSNNSKLDCDIDIFFMSHINTIQQINVKIKDLYNLDILKENLKTHNRKLNNLSKIILNT